MQLHPLPLAVVFVTLLIQSNTPSKSAETFAAPSPYHCLQGKIRTVMNGSTSIEASAYCLGSDSSLAYSKNCASPAKCAALSTPLPPEKDLRLERLSVELGNPGFQLCRIIGGNPTMIDYQDPKGAWRSSSRCQFASDQSFCSIDQLWDRFKASRKPVQ